MQDIFKKLVEIIQKTKIDFKFTIVEIGALPVSNLKPRFYKI